MNDRSVFLSEKGFIPLDGRSLDLNKYADVYDVLLPPGRLVPYPTAREIQAKRKCASTACEQQKGGAEM